MSPLQNTRVIHSGWSVHHRPVAQSAMTGVCSIFEPREGPAPFPLPEVYNGLRTLATDIICRVQVLNNSSSSISAEQPVGTRQYLVAIPIDGTPAIAAGEGGTIIKLTSAKDPRLVGRVLQVIDVQHGTEMFERDLVCVDNLTQNNP